MDVAETSAPEKDAGAGMIDGADGPSAAEPDGDAAHVLVVDDDARIRSLLKQYLQRSGFRVTEARDAAHARRLTSTFNFDILVVDIMMPGEDGLSFTTWIDGRMPVILLTARGETSSRIEGLEAGADDYLSKPFDPRELRLRIEAILRRAQRLSPGLVAERRMLKLGAVRFDVERGELWRGDEPVRLTTAEATLMRLLARRANEAVSRWDLLTELGAETHVDRTSSDSLSQERAIDVQITRLRRKVEATPKAPRFIKTIRGAGYMLAPEADDPNDNGV